MDKKLKYPGTLHAHTDFSNMRLRDAINTVESVIDYAIEIGNTALAITEHETIGSSLRALRHYNKVKEDNPDFKLILGNEIYLTRNGLNPDNFIVGQDRYYHFILLAKDAKGHEMIRDLSTRAGRRSYIHRRMMRTPTYYQDLHEIISENPNRLVGTTACLGGVLGTQLLRYRENGDPALLERIKKWVVQMNNLFGDGNFYLELQPSHNEEQIYVNHKIIELSKELNVPYLISTDAHYLKKEDRSIHKAFLTAQQGEREVDAFYMSTYLMNTEEIYEYMEKYVGEEVLQTAFANSNKIVAMCEDYELEQNLYIPYLPKNPKEPTEELLEQWEKKVPLTRQFGESERSSERHLITEVLTRIEKDPDLQNKETYDEVQGNLETIDKSSGILKTDWSAYMLNVKDYIDIIWDEGDSIVPPGRGSSGGFILNYILGITQMNPLKERTRTFPWRFLNPERVSPLDIDLDIEAAKREKVYSALQRNYGQDRVVKILTLRTEKARSAIQTAARGLGIDSDTAAYISSFVSAERGMNRSLTQMFYGDEEEGLKPDKEFVRLMTQDYPRLWEVAYSIEGLINGAGSHAGGVIFTDEPFYKRTALMKTNGGDLVTQFDLDDAEKVGLIKIDLLSLEAADKMRKTLDLLVEYGFVEAEPTLRETYEKVIGVYNLEREDPKMWEMLWNHEVTSLFQMEQQSGVQGIEVTKPQNVDELAVLNSVIRLMVAKRGAEQPVRKFARFKNNPEDWIREMEAHGLTEEEMNILKPILEVSHGLCVTQEQFMQLVQLPELGGHSLLWADRLRKAVAKKSPQDFEDLTQEFFETVREQNLSMRFAEYAWNVLIAMNRGYGFNASHTLLYSLIALQELNLAYRYPVIFWNTACLIVDSGGVEIETVEIDEEEEELEAYTDSPILFIEEKEDEEEDEDGKLKTKKKANTTKKINYGKIASAIGNYQNKGIEVSPPDINLSSFTYSPDVKNNVIKSGMNGISRIGDKLVHTIMDNRPYHSVEDFLERVKVNKPQMINLIKSGAFDGFEDRIALMEWYTDSIGDKKNVINLRNMRLVIEYNILPPELDYERKVYNFTQYIRGMKDGDYYLLDHISTKFYEYNYNIDDARLAIVNGEGSFKILRKDWEKIYNKEMNPIRDYLKKHQEEVKTKINNNLAQEMWDKYASGTISKWEMDSVSYYSHEHELEAANLEAYGFKSFNELPEEPEVESIFYARGKPVALLKIERLAGTVIDKDKSKRTVTLLTTDGVAIVKIFGAVYSHYDKQISEPNPKTGGKRVVERSMFTRGNKVVIAGIRKGNFFIAKKYKKHPFHLVEKIEEIKEDGSLVLTSR